MGDRVRKESGQLVGGDVGLPDDIEALELILFDESILVGIAAWVRYLHDREYLPGARHVDLPQRPLLVVVFIQVLLQLLLDVWVADVVEAL